MLNERILNCSCIEANYGYLVVKGLRKEIMYRLRLRKNFLQYSTDNSENSTTKKQYVGLFKKPENLLYQTFKTDLLMIVENFQKLCISKKFYKKKSIFPNIKNGSF